MSYTIMSSLYGNATEASDALVEEYMTAGGLNNHKELVEMIAPEGSDDYWLGELDREWGWRDTGLEEFEVELAMTRFLEKVETKQRLIEELEKWSTISHTPEECVDAFLEGEKLWHLETNDTDTNDILIGDLGVVAFDVESHWLPDPIPAEWHLMKIARHEDHFRASTRAGKEERPWRDSA